MSKASAPVNPVMKVTFDYSSLVPLHRQIYNWIRQAILNGQLRAGERLPATRTLATQLAISRNTVSTAYAQLLAEGYLDSATGYGTTVAKTLPEMFIEAKNEAKNATNLDVNQSLVKRPVIEQPILSQVGSQIANFPNTTTLSRILFDTTIQTAKTVPFRTGSPALEVFPFKIWEQLAMRRLRYALPLNSGYQDAAGYPPLREAIAAHLAVARGVRCQPEQIIIVTGSQGGLDLAIRLLLNPGDTAWIEDPGYFGARFALQNAGVHLAPVRVTDDGLDVEMGSRKYPQARLAFVTPSHQFPTGVTMSLAKRLALLKWASTNQAWILEDDYDSEYRFGGRPLEALQGLDIENRVIYIGTFSKVLFPALRLGYLVVPPNLVETFVRFRRFMAAQPPILEQMIVTDFITEGHFLRHIRKMRELYQNRRNLLVAAVKNELGAEENELLEVKPSQAGLHLVGWLPAGIDDLLVAQLAAEQGLEVVPLSSLSLEPPPRRGLMLGYGSVKETEITEAVQKLIKIISVVSKQE